ncbi:MAG: cytochrome c biogenesis protein CcdA [Thiobacillus sp.]|nr:cytochrome c biogenesis protein CcdA [Thiobacillus sp.]
MDIGAGTYAMAVAAGALSTLSPCVLPLIPILLGSALAVHALGPVVLAGGLSLSFAAMGIVLAALGASLEVDPTHFRNGAAVLLMGFALILLSTRLQAAFARAASGLAGAGNSLLARLALTGLTGQFALGLLLGVVWSPCVGPTLGAAITLASQGRDLAAASLVMLLFGLGAGLPVILIGLLSRQALGRVRGRLVATGKWGKQLLGGMLLALGVMILTGADKRFEAWTLDAMPAWLVTLTTRL